MQELLKYEFGPLYERLPCAKSLPVDKARAGVSMGNAECSVAEIELKSGSINKSNCIFSVVRLL